MILKCAQFSGPYTSLHSRQRRQLIFGSPSKLHRLCQFSGESRSIHGALEMPGNAICPLKREKSLLSPQNRQVSFRSLFSQLSCRRAAFYVKKCQQQCETAMSSKISKRVVCLLTFLTIVLFCVSMYLWKRIEQENSTVARPLQQRFYSCEYIYSGITRWLETGVHLIQFSDFSRERYSWRFRICPFVGPQKRDREPRFDSRWDSPENALIVADAEFQVDFHDARGFAVVSAILGADTAFDPEDKIIDIDQLPADLVLFIEVRQFRHHWMEPWDLNLADLNSIEPVSNQWWCDAEPFLVCFADGKIWEIDSSIPCSLLGRFCTKSECIKEGRHQAMGNYFRTQFRD